MGKGDPKGGRPVKEIDLGEMEKLASIQATARECASWFNVSEDTIDLRLKDAGYAGFTEFYKKHQGPGNVSLRRKQFETAMTGNPTLLIWLGKNWLGQTDKMEHSGDINITLPDFADDL
jgi:hypothetical protein